MSEILWKPSQTQIDSSRMAGFMAWLSERYGREFSNYQSLYDWSVTHIEDFWASIWEHSQIIHSQRYTSVLIGKKIWDTKWFEKARLNFAENLLRHRDDKTAIIHWQEGVDPSRLSFNELYRQVAACAHGLRQLGVQKGDRVAAFIPNIPEAVVAMLAATSIGAIWSSCSPDFGFNGVLDRFSQIEPKILITADGYRYGGKEFDSLSVVYQLAISVPSIEKIIVVPRLSERPPKIDDRALLWSHLVATPKDNIVFEQLPFDHPLYIMYSSGTTGKPKCIVHGAGGTLLQHYKEHALHTNLGRDEVIMYFTTCGWMMWNWLVSGLNIGATIFLFDGSPGYPDLTRLWKAIEQEKIAVFGTSPKYLSSCQSAAIVPADIADLSSLRTILTTGSPLSDDNFDWVYKSVKEDVQLASISGGTDIISCFALGNPILPVHKGELQCRGLGMKVEAYDADGKSMIDQVGELVCTAPFPSRPVYFYNDSDHEKYRAAYFDHYRSVWRHGDFIKITSQGGVVVYGRSDATLNPGGVRIGTAEIYGPVESMEEISDSLVVAQRWKDDSRIVLFVVLAKGLSLNRALSSKIKSRIREIATPRHVPSMILQIDEVPYTLNGKKVELAATRAIHGEEITNREALVNPDSLDQFLNIPELASS